MLAPKNSYRYGGNSQQQQQQHQGGGRWGLHPGVDQGYYLDGGGGGLWRPPQQQQGEAYNEGSWWSHGGHGENGAGAYESYGGGGGQRNYQGNWIPPSGVFSCRAPLAEQSPALLSNVLVPVDGIVNA